MRYHAPVRIAVLSAAGFSFMALVVGPRTSLAAPAKVSPDHYRVYVTNELSGTLSEIDGLTLEVLNTIPVGKRPRGVRASPDGRNLYVALSGSPIAGPGIDVRDLPGADKTADGIGVIATQTFQLVKIIRGVSDPEQLAVSRDGRTLFISSEDTSTACVIDVRSGALVKKVSTGAEPEGADLSPDGRVVYVTSEEDGTVTPILVRSHSPLNRIKVGTRPRNTAFAADGERAYVTNEGDASVSVINTQTREVTHTIPVPGPNARPMDVVISRDDRLLFVTTGHGGQVVSIDTETLKPLKAVDVGRRPWGLALSPDGRLLYTANGLSDDVSVVDTATMRVIAAIKVGQRPWGIAIVSGRFDH